MIRRWRPASGASGNPLARVGAAIAVAVLVAACAGAASAPLNPGTSPEPVKSEVPFQVSLSAPPAPSASTLATPEDPLHGSSAVAFTTDDGVAIEGRVFGAGKVGVVLAHGQFENGQGSWFSFAQTLSAKGYLVLTLNLRGYCPGGLNGCSGGSRNPPETWRDVVAGARYLEASGTARVFIMGASLGARSCLWAASRPGVSVTGVIAVSAPLKAVGDYTPAYDFTRDVIAAIKEPKLLIAGDGDANYAMEAQTMFDWAVAPKELSIVPSTAHGPILMGAPKAINAVLDFLQRYR